MPTKRRSPKRQTKQNTKTKTKSKSKKVPMISSKDCLRALDDVACLVPSEHYNRYIYESAMKCKSQRFRLEMAKELLKYNEAYRYNIYYINL